MHILILSSEPYRIPTVPLGGIFQYHQANALREAGHDAGVASGALLPLRDVLTFRGRPTQDRESKSLVVRSFKKSYLPLRFSSESFVHRSNIDQMVRAGEIYIRQKGQPDCIHAHNLQYAGIAALELSRRYRIPFVLTEHNSSFMADTYPTALVPQFLEVLDNSAANIAVSQSLSTKMDHLFPPKQSKFTVVPNVIDMAFSAGVVRRTPSDFVFLSIGRLDKNKNHALLIKAFAAAFANTRVQLRIGGAGAEEGSLRALVTSLGVEKQVAFLGFLSRERVAEEFGAASCFVLPSLKETFGVVVIEALSFGVPVVAAPCGGPDDIIRPDNGIITPDHTVESMTKALQEIHRNHDLFRPEKIREDALERFAPSSFARNILEIYRHAIAGTADILERN